MTFNSKETTLSPSNKLSKIKSPKLAKFKIIKSEKNANNSKLMRSIINGKYAIADLGRKHAKISSKASSVQISNFHNSVHVYNQNRSRQQHTEAGDLSKRN